MGITTNISWTDATWNPWRGCKKISEGCKNCYMYREQIYYGNNPNNIIKSTSRTFNSPLKWQDDKKVFTCSWSDFFIENADNWRDEAWEIIRKTPHLIYQILTKRPENIKDRLPSNWGIGWDNVWIGVTVELNKYLWRIDILNEIPVKLKFVSYEPALEAIDFTDYLKYIQWLIGGGESGSNARKAKPEWFEDVKSQCDKFNVAYFHKQNGGNNKINGTWGDKELNGKIYNEFPKGL